MFVLQSGCRRRPPRSVSSPDALGSDYPLSRYFFTGPKNHVGTTLVIVRQAAAHGCGGDCFVTGFFSFPCIWSWSSSLALVSCVIFLPPALLSRQGACRRSAPTCWVIWLDAGARLVRSDIRRSSFPLGFVCVASCCSMVLPTWVSLLGGRAGSAD